MSSINYCTLDEAWGKSNISASSNCNIHSQHKKRFEKDNPLKTPNVNYQCSKREESNNNQIELKGYQSEQHSHYTGGKTIQPINPSFYKMNNENQELYSFITTLNLDESTKKILIRKISNAFDSIKYEDESNVKEDFTQRYYQDNRNVDILFLILLGMFIIFILDKK
tara:strand:- start:175 stop:675 length:501 start_codon:yes stop_codon:yes gene_type:complete